MFHNSPLESSISVQECPDQFSVELTKQQIYGSLRRSRKKGQNVGINTSRMLLFNNSSQLIQPITHLHFSEPQIPKYQNDGIDEQSGAPNKSTVISPIYKSQQTTKRTQSTFHSTKQTQKNTKNIKQSIRAINYNPQKLQNMKANIKQSEKIQRIVYENLKNVQIGQDLVKQSRKKSQKFVNLFEGEDKPVVKKSFKISAPFRLSESKLNAKQEILADARKMVDYNVHKLKQKEESKLFEKEKEKSRSISKSRSKSKQNLTNSQNKYNKQNSSRYKPNPPPDPSSQSLYIHLLSPISFLKQTLIESSQHLTVSFSMPASLFTPPHPTTSLSLIKQSISQIFLQAGMQTHIVSIKKYTDRVEIKNKNLCIIWYYDGRGYFGQWKGGEQILANLNRHGVGLLWAGQGQTGEIYYGEFRDDKKQGYGILKQDNGQIYVGEWKDGRKSGWGKLYGSDHQLKCKGQFNDDIFVGCP